MQFPTKEFVFHTFDASLNMATIYTIIYTSSTTAFHHEQVAILTTELSLPRFFMITMPSDGYWSTGLIRSCNTNASPLQCRPNSVTQLLHRYNFFYKEAKSTAATELGPQDLHNELVNCKSVSKLNNVIH